MSQGRLVGLERMIMMVRTMIPWGWRGREGLGRAREDGEDGEVGQDHGGAREDGEDGQDHDPVRMERQGRTGRAREDGEDCQDRDPVRMERQGRTGRAREDEVGQGWQGQRGW